MANNFQSFGQVHILLIAVTIILAGLIFVCAKRLGDRSWFQHLLQFIAVGVIIQEIINQAARLILGDWRVGNDLLIHMCGLMVFVLPYAIFSKKRWAIELCYYWGVGGSLVAILTPSLDYGFPDYRAILFFVCHILLFVGSMGLLGQTHYRPSRRGLIMVLMISALSALGAGFISWLMNIIWVGTQANYWFLLHSPRGTTLASLMPRWPWYPFYMMGLGLVIIMAMYVFGNLVLFNDKSSKK